jgi:AraC family transcriptional regulator, positive regulator of tynA and feaB
VAQAERRRYEILHFVETRLADPELSAGAVARRFGISDRYLRMLFAQDGESVADYVARRRLEECARRLADPRWRHCTVSEVAIAWGFNSLGSFDRAFKQRFQCTPQAFRAASLAAAAGPETSVPVKSGFRGG